MKKNVLKPIVFTTVAFILLNSCAKEKAIYSSDEFSWYANRITQGEYTATAINAMHIVSNYQSPTDTDPEKTDWIAKNDFTDLPRYTAPGLLENAVYNMGLDEMINAIEPDSTLRTGKDWAGVWTRDVSYSIILSMAHMQPEVSKISLMRKVNARMRIIQDTGTGGAWPCSTDRMIWVSAAWEIYLATGDREWLKDIYPIIRFSLDDDRITAFDPISGLMYGETSFIDWREQSYPEWMQPADIYQSKAHGTNVLYAHALQIASKIGQMMNDTANAKKYGLWADSLRIAINEKFRLDDEAYSPSYLYGRNADIAVHRAESLGEALGVLWDITDEDRQSQVVEAMPLTPYGTPVFYPFIPDMFSYHNNAMWPFPAAYYGMAAAKVDNSQRVLYTFAVTYRAAAMFCTNKENFELTSGDYDPMPMNSDNMLWSLSGNIGLTHKVLFGMRFTEDGLRFAPYIPKEMNGMRRLSNFKYRKALLDITVEGYGNKISEFTVNGAVSEEHILPANAEGEYKIVIRLENNKLNHSSKLGKHHIHKKNMFSTKMPVISIDSGHINIAPSKDAERYVIFVNGKKAKEIKQRDEMRIPLSDDAMKGEVMVVAHSKDGGYSLAAEPVSNFMFSNLYEIVRYHRPANNSIKGYYASEYVKLTKNMESIEIPIDVKTDGIYSFDFHYANGNGPINTENKCCIRSLDVDGQFAGAVVLPHRGSDNWVDWGWSNKVIVPIKAGRHTISLYFRDENHNMNIATNTAIADQMRVTQIK